MTRIEGQLNLQTVGVPRDSGIVDAVADKLPTAGLILGGAAFLAMIPLHRPPSPAAANAVRGAASLGSKLRLARESFGGTAVGKGLLLAEKPLIAASTALSGALLVKDTNDYLHGHGSLWNIGVDAVGVIPGFSTAAKGALRARSLHQQARGASKVTNLLHEAESATTKAAAVSKQLGGEAGRVVDIVEDAVSTSRATTSLAVTGAKAPEKALRRIPRVSDTPLVTALRSQLDDLERQATTVVHSDVPASGEVVTAVKHEMDKAGEIARIAKSELSNAGRKAARLERKASTAESVTTVADTTSTGTGIVNNGLALQQQLRNGRQGDPTLSTYNLARLLTGIALGKNAKAPVVAANPS